MSTKHIHNSSKTLVADALTGLTYLNPHLNFLSKTATLILSPDALANDAVSLVCGGGSGHEPSHGGFVGKGMLSAAVCGQVFASPNSRQVEDTLMRLKQTKGTLIIVKNYTGDVIQFGLACERWNAINSTSSGSSSVRMVIVGDDVSVPRSAGTLTGRRGLAGTVLVYKLAGALASGVLGKSSAKGSLDDVEYLANVVAKRLGTVGVGLDHCHVPGTEAGEGESYLKKDEIEIGMGIHNEPGNRKISPIPPTSKLVDQLLTSIIDTSDKERGFVDFKNDGKDEVVLLVNNLGGLPELEIMGIVKESVEWLEGKKITVERVLAGSYTSSLNLPGFSLTLLLLPRSTDADVKPQKFESKLTFDKELLLDCLDTETEAPGWRWFYKGKVAKVERKEKLVQEKENEKVGATVAGEEGKKLPPTDSKLFTECLKLALKNVIAAEPEITRFDTVGGDGDAGLTLKAGAEGVQKKLISGDDVIAAMVKISETAEVDMGGTSGGLYSIFFAALGKGLITAMGEKKESKATAEVWSRALDLALNSLYVYTRARPPSRTLVDPLAAFILTFSSNPQDFLGAFTAAKDAAEATRNLDAKAGRSAYVDKEMLEKANVPDAGAWGVLKILEGVKEALDKA